MNTILFYCIAPLTLLAACAATNHASIGADERGAARLGCCGVDCEVTAECHPDGSCVITCTSVDGVRREIVIDCDTPCTADACSPANCDVNVECTADGRARVACEDDSGSTCERVVECCPPAASSCAGR